MTRAAARTALFAAGALACAAAIDARSSAADLPGAVGRLRLHPAHIRVFAGATYRFRAALQGDAAPLSWSIVGDGAVDTAGTYRAPPTPGSAVIIARAGRSAAAASVDVVTPPPPGVPLLFVTCFEDGDVRAYDARDLREAGALAIPAKAGGIAADATTRRVVVAAGDRVYAVDAATMHVRASERVGGARFSEVAVLAAGYVAATDNEAVAHRPGVRVFRVTRDGLPVLVFSIDAGETPEGIAPARHGREFYVTSVNSAEVRRFGFDPANGVRLLALGRTGNRPFGVAVDEARSSAFVADNDTTVVSGTRSHPGLESFDALHLHRLRPVLATGSPQSLPLGVAVDARGARLFVTNEGDRSLAVYALPALRRIATVGTGRLPWLPAFDAATHRLVVPEAGADAFEVFDTRRLRRASAAISACGYPTSAAFLPAAVPARR